MRYTYKSQYSKLFDRLESLKNVPKKGEKWAQEGAKQMRVNLIAHLKSQGRSGQPPPLTRITLHLYSLRGNPSGSGIRKHIRVEHHKLTSGYSSTCGILQGKPSMVARVQDRGASIRVSEKMRNWFMAHGIFLKATTRYIHIPARYFWQNSWKKTKKSQIQALKKIHRSK